MKPDSSLIVYYADVRALEEDELYHRAFSGVSEQRKEKARKYSSGKDRRLSLTAELLLKKALSDRGLFPADLHYEYGKNGKPALSGLPEFFFSISHSGDYVMLSVSRSETGCDIEKIRDMDLSVAKRFFHPEEYAHICSVPPAERTELFFRYWTLKESFLKLTGEGLRLPMRSFRIDLSQPDIPAELFFRDKTYYFHEPELCEGYFCTVGTSETVRLEIHHEDIRAVINQLL